MFDWWLKDWIGLAAGNPEDILRTGAMQNMTDLQFIEKETTNWLQCPKRMMQLKGNSYYRYEHDFDEVVDMAKDADGMPIQKKRTKGRIINNEYGDMVDQKVNYLLGKPFSLQTQNEDYTKLLSFVFDKEFKRMLNRVTVDCLNGGLSWVHPYFSPDGELLFKHFPGYQILPFWADDDHTILDAAIRYYCTYAYENLTEKTVHHVEVFTKDGIARFILENGKLTPDPDLPGTPYASGTDAAGNVVPAGWDKVPLVAFKYNAQEIPLIKRVIAIQDTLNKVWTNWSDAMTEDVRDAVLVLRNYDGEDIADFRRKLMYYGAVKVSDEGGVDVLRIERDPSAYTTFLAEAKKAIVERSRGFDSKDDRMSSNPNEMNLRSMYSDIDLDADMMETQYQAAFDQLLWFVDRYLIQAGKPDFTKEEVVFTFNRNIMVNDTDTIANIRNSEGLVSSETLLAHHPYVTDVQGELQKVAAEKQQNMDQYDTYRTGVGDGQSGTD